MTPSGLDRAVASFLREVASPAADALFGAFTFLASGAVTLALLLAAAVALAAAGRSRAAATLVAAWCAGAGVVHLVKGLVGRARPSLEYTVTQHHSAAFPSGHSANAVVAFGLLALLAGERWPGARRPAAVAAVLVALGAGLSRVYLGVHWATDVLGGWAVGASVLAAAAAAIRRAPRASPPSPSPGSRPA